MTEVAPRIELEPGLAPRLEEQAPVLIPSASPGRGGVGLALAGIVTLIGGFFLFWSADLIAGLFARASLLAWPALAVTVVGLGLILAGIWRELRGLAALRRIDAIRADLAAADIATVRQGARAFLAQLPEHLALHAGLEAGLAAIDQPDALRALLRVGPCAGLRAKSDQLGRAAAWQTAAIVAATPAPALDALVVAWRGVRLVRDVAQAFGLRPGLLGTLRLLRRTALAAASVAITDAAVNAASAALVSNPLLEHLLGDVAGAGVAARRMIVLARAAAAACDPLA